MTDKPQTTRRWPQFVFWWGWLGFGFKDVPQAFRSIYSRFLFLGPLEVRFWQFVPKKEPQTMKRNFVYQLRLYIGELVFGWCFNFCLWVFPRGNCGGTLMAMHVNNWANAVTKEMKDGTI